MSYTIKIIIYNYIHADIIKYMYHFFTDIDYMERCFTNKTEEKKK